jgi:hypothetical protein
MLLMDAKMVSKRKRESTASGEDEDEEGEEAVVVSGE